LKHFSKYRSTGNSHTGLGQNEVECSFNDEKLSCLPLKNKEYAFLAARKV